MSAKVSVITATWNCEGTVQECLDSFAEQSWTNREHIVIDGASTDRTVEILEANSHRIDVLLSEPDTGIYDALNKGIRQASGDVIGFLHADDVYASPNVLAMVAAAFEDPSVAAIYGDLQYVQREDPSIVVRHWRSSSFSRTRLDWGWMPPHPTLYVRREWYEEIGGFDLKYRISADYHSILRLFSRNDFRAKYLPGVLVKMRLGGASNRSLANILLKSREDLHALKATRVGAFGGWGALIWKNIGKIDQFLAAKRAA